MKNATRAKLTTLCWQLVMAAKMDKTIGLSKIHGINLGVKMAILDCLEAKISVALQLNVATQFFKHKDYLQSDSILQYSFDGKFIKYDFK